MHWLRRLRLTTARPAQPRRIVSPGGLTVEQRHSSYLRGRRDLTPAQRRRIRKHENRAKGFPEHESATT